MADVTQLLSLSEESVMQNTMVRFSRDEIYTYVGSLLLAVNPYKALAVLTRTVPGPPYCTYGRRVPASCVLYVQERTGQLAPGGANTVRTYGLRVPATCVPYVPRTMAPA